MTTSKILIIYIVQFVLGFLAWNRIFKEDRKGAVVVSLLIIPNFLLVAACLTHYTLKLIEKCRRKKIKKNEKTSKNRHKRK